MTYFLDRLRAWFEFDLAATRLTLLRFAPELEPFFTLPAQVALRWLDGFRREQA